jgi:hypothetical protein
MWVTAEGLPRVSAAQRFPREAASRPTSTIKTLGLVGAARVYAPPSTLSDAVTTFLSALSYRTQSWSMSMATAAGLYW